MGIMREDFCLSEKLVAQRLGRRLVGKNGLYLAYTSEELKKYFLPRHVYTYKLKGKGWIAKYLINNPNDW